MLWPRIDLAVSTSSLLEHLFLGCSLLEPSCHAVKSPLVGMLIASPRWSHSWSQHQLPTMWMSSIKLMTWWLQPQLTSRRAELPSWAWPTQNHDTIKWLLLQTITFRGSLLYRNRSLKQYLTPLRFGFFLCKMELIMVPISWDCFEHWMRLNVC